VSVGQISGVAVVATFVDTTDRPHSASRLSLARSKHITDLKILNHKMFYNLKIVFYYQLLFHFKIIRISEMCDNLIFQLII